MKYLLDTCVVSELTKKTPQEDVVNWIKNKDESELYLSVLTIGELHKGITKLEKSRKKQILIQWIETELRKRFDKRILNITEEVAKKWGEIQAKAEQEGKKMPVIDGLIAATGLVFELQIITRNIADMTISEVNLYNPWNSEL